MELSPSDWERLGREIAHIVDARVDAKLRQMRLIDYGYVAAAPVTGGDGITRVDLAIGDPGNPVTHGVPAKGGVTLTYASGQPVSSQQIVRVWKLNSPNSAGWWCEPR